MAAADNKAAPWTFVLDEPTRILVVDDDPILREFATVYLSSPCATIDTACDGVAARIRLGQVPYDVVLLDIEMPQLDGFSLLLEIRSDERLRHLPVIMLTGHDDIASIDRAYHAGANSFASKPVNWRKLSYQIRYVLRTSRLEHLQDHSRGRGKLPGTEAPAVPPVTERDVRDFLAAVAHRAVELEEQLSAHDRARCSAPLQGVRSVAQRAFAESSGRVPGPAADCAHRADVIDQDDARADDRPPPHRRSVNVVG
jgi:DNA-binding response OmpR family regulator